MYMLSMIMRTSCCVGLYPPTSSNASPPQIPPMMENKGGCWRRKCVVIGVAAASCYTIIGLELAAAAKELDQGDIMFVMTTTTTMSSPAKWSQKRACLPWRGNSLETIVPENLPRPAARRRYQAALRSTSKTAPPLSAHSVKLQTNGDNCFFM